MGASFNAFSFPLLAIGSVVLLIIRLGWPGALGIAVILISVAITNCISKRNGLLISEINKIKDKRVETTSNVIDGIRFIKLYGWETAFQKIIKNIRELEIKSFKTLGLGRSL